MNDANDAQSDARPTNPELPLQPLYVLPQTGLNPDAEAVWTPEGSLTWVQLEERARRFANALLNEGVGPEGRWAILSMNRLEMAELVIGNARAGARSVFLNWHLTPAELVDLLNDAQAGLLIVSPDQEDLGRSLAQQAGVAKVIVFGPDYEDWLASANDTVPPDHRVGSPLLYTGGTTGKSKGVTRSDMSAPVSVWSMRGPLIGAVQHMPTEGRTLITTPLYHALGQLMGLTNSLLCNHSVSIVAKFDPEQTLAMIQERKITSMTMVPTQFVKLLKLDDDVRARYDVSSVKWIIHTAAPCPPWAKKGMIDWFGPVVVELYGSSEGTGPVISTSLDWLERPGTVGRAAASLTLSIVDDDGNDLPPGEIGTIYVKRSDGTPVYEGDPEKTKSIQLPDGRFTVGDVGWMDGDGFLYLADRRVDLILVGGSNVYPAEIEGVLSSHPMVADAAVFGIPHAELGQEVKAVIEPVEGATVDTAEIDRYVRSQLASFKVPRSYDIVEKLPREAHGKLKKRLLRDPYWA